MRAIVMLGIALAATACAMNSPPVLVAGAPGDLQQLTGEWDGEYASAEAGRSGSIYFKLTGARDTARGDVLMIPRDHSGNRDYLNPGTSMRLVPRALTIKFVDVDGDVIAGTMDPYDSPDCEHQLLTTFHGVIRGNRVEGTFIIYHVQETPERYAREIQQEGTWWVERRVKR
jgi:hypothetical protein